MKLKAFSCGSSLIVHYEPNFKITGGGLVQV
jgi:hypothetical protein